MDFKKEFPPLADDVLENFRSVRGCKGERAAEKACEKNNCEACDMITLYEILDSNKNLTRLESRAGFSERPTDKINWFFIDEEK